ncbi:glutathione synthase [Nitrosomonas oligotropha]|uniref:Glutathione synthetase n=1 Tax=Nitrosomonas oligotropha TaxID=42354 RepID=A0A2T5HZ96_9PROT|nr:glutathione synthase [Nitrosomonas oligotropha]PTQ76893.1 glutathione synthase [Nitrosomonas oligotropha]
MKLAFVIDQLDSIKTAKDSSFAMMREAIARNHQIYVLYQHDIVLTGNTVTGFCRSLTITDTPGRDGHWYNTSDSVPTPLNQFDAVLMRKDPPFDLEYVYSTYLLELAQTQGAFVINSPRAIRDHNEKLAIAQFPQWIVPTLVTSQAHLIREFLAQHQDIILKPLDGMGGASVFRVHSADHNISVILETLTHYGTRTIMAQRFIPEIAQGDKRILLIGGKPVPYALARIPKPGESRGNLAAGGTGKAQPLSAHDQAIAESLGPELAKRGLMLVGLDVIGDYLTEVNVTSPTGMQEITQQTGFNVAGMMLDAIEASIQNKKH